MHPKYLIHTGALMEDMITPITTIWLHAQLHTTRAVNSGISEALISYAYT